MRVVTVFGVLAATIALAACGSAANTGAHAARRAFASPGFHYAVSYDPARFSAAVDRDASGVGLDQLVPGIGKVHGDVETLIAGAKDPASLAQVTRGEFQLTALKPQRAQRRPSLAAFRREPYLRKLEAHGWVTSRPRKVALNGLPAFRYTMRFRGVTTVDYAVYDGAFIYAMNLEAPSKRWSVVGPSREAVARSFTVTP